MANDCARSSKARASSSIWIRARARRVNNVARLRGGACSNAIVHMTISVLGLPEPAKHMVSGLMAADGVDEIVNSNTDKRTSNLLLSPENSLW